MLEAGTRSGRTARTADPRRRAARRSAGVPFVKESSGTESAATFARRPLSGRRTGARRGPSAQVIVRFARPARRCRSFRPGRRRTGHSQDIDVDRVTPGEARSPRSTRSRARRTERSTLLRARTGAAGPPEGAASCRVTPGVSSVRVCKTVGVSRQPSLEEHLGRASPSGSQRESYGSVVGSGGGGGPPGCPAAPQHRRPTTGEESTSDRSERPPEADWRDCPRSVRGQGRQDRAGLLRRRHRSAEMGHCAHGAVRYQRELRTAARAPRFEGGIVTLAYDKQKIKNAPNVGPGSPPVAGRGGAALPLL